MKKIVAILTILSVILCMTLTSCGKKDEVEEETKQKGLQVKEFDEKNEDAIDFNDLFETN